jgi:hypothetical protein
VARHVDFRVHAQVGLDVEVVRYDAADEFGILITHPRGVGMEAVLTRAQAEQLAADLDKELERDRSEP